MNYKATADDKEGLENFTLTGHTGGKKLIAVKESCGEPWTSMLWKKIAHERIYTMARNNLAV